MRIEYEGKFTLGYYNAMEAGHPVFIDGEPVDEVIKNELSKMGIGNEFCCGPSYHIGENDPEKTGNSPLIGRKVKLILEIGD